MRALVLETSSRTRRESCQPPLAASTTGNIREVHPVHLRSCPRPNASQARRGKLRAALWTMSLALTILVPLLAVAAPASAPGAGLSIVPRSFDYELNHARGVAIPMSVAVANDAVEREVWVLVVVHDIDTEQDIEVYSSPRVVPAGGKVTFGAADGLVVRLPRDGVYAMTAVVFTAGPSGDVRVDTLHETRPMYVGSARRIGCGH